MEAGGIVLLDDEGEGSGAPLWDGVGGLGGGREVALLAVLVEGLGHDALRRREATEAAGQATASALTVRLSGIGGGVTTQPLLNGWSSRFTK